MHGFAPTGSFASIKAKLNEQKFKPGQSGNSQTRFKPGNQHRWQPRQSGNPAGIAQDRIPLPLRPEDRKAGYHWICSHVEAVVGCKVR